jgi:hypothetical protein
MPRKFQDARLSLIVAQYAEPGDDRLIGEKDEHGEWTFKTIRLAHGNDDTGEGRWKIWRWWNG